MGLKTHNFTSSCVSLPGPTTSHQVVFHYRDPQLHVKLCFTTGTHNFKSSCVSLPGPTTSCQVVFHYRTHNFMSSCVSLPDPQLHMGKIVCAQFESKHVSKLGFFCIMLHRLMYFFPYDFHLFTSSYIIHILIRGYQADILE